MQCSEPLQCKVRPLRLREAVLSVPVCCVGAGLDLHCQPPWSHSVSRATYFGCNCSCQLGVPVWQTLMVGCAMVFSKRVKGSVHLPVECR